MKRFLMFLGLIAVPVFLLAQDTIVVDPTIPTTPTDMWDFILHFNEWIGTFGGIVVATAFLTAFLNGLLKVTKNFVKQLVAWGVAIILLVGTDLLNIGYAKDLPILLAVIHGVAAGLAANGVFDIPVLKAILDKVEGWFNKE